MKELKYIKILFSLLIISFVNNLNAQTNLQFSTNESGNTVTHVATESVKLLQGYEYTPTSSLHHHSYIDKTIPGDETYPGGMITDQLLDREINTSLSVGYIDGAHTITPYGAANYTIPIKLPPGTNGSVPEISITYSSQGGNGELGVGWNINGLSAISRVGKTNYHDDLIEPVKLDNTDKFALDGNRLIADYPMGYGVNNMTYKTEVESFSKITQHGLIPLKGPEWFEVETKDGKIIEYGNTVDSKMLSDDASAIIYWRVNKITDIYGNYIEYVYKNDGRHSRIDKILYTGNSVSGLLPYNTIQFFYDNRTDMNTIYVGGSSLTTKYLLKKIQLLGAGDVARSYNFKYGLNKYSFLTEVIETGKEGGELNSTLFKYGNSPQEFQVIPSNIISDNTNPIISGDFNGDGYFDLMELTSTDVNFHLNAKNNNFSLLNINSIQNPTSTERAINSKMTGVFNTISGIADYLGKGKDNILTTEVNEVGSIYYVNGHSISALNNNDQFPVEYSSDYTNSFYTTDLTKFLYNGDFDGDGEMDFFTLLKLGSQNYVKFHFPQRDEIIDLTPSSVALINNADDIQILNYDGDQVQDILVRKGSTTSIYKITYSSSYYHLTVLYSSSLLINNNTVNYNGDFNGDGKTDLLIKDNSNSWNIAYSTGNITYPSSTSFETMPFSFQNTVDVNTQKIIIADYNGDGKTDIMHAYMTSPYNSATPSSIIKIYYSLGNNVFSAPSVLNVTSDLNEEILMSGDFNGDGNVDHINRPYNDALPLKHFYFNEDNKELLLEKVLDGFNQLTTFTYDYLTRDNVYTKENDATYPLIDIQPPIAVVTSVTIPDGVGGDNTTSYLYDGAKIHRKHKGFLGFHIVSAENNVSESKTITEYEFTIYGTPKLDGSKFMGSTPKEIQFFSTESGNTLKSRITYINLQKNLPNNRFFPYVKFITTSTFLDSQYGRDQSESFLYDDYGNVISHSINLPNETGVTTTINTYQQYNTWIPSSLKTSTVSKYKQGPGNSSVARTIEYDYYPNGSVKIIKADVGTSNEVDTEYEYNTFGNIMKKTVSTAGADNRETNYNYDSKGRFVIETINPLTQKSLATYSHLWGVPLTQTDVNGLTTNFDYDEFGTLISVASPDNVLTETVYAWDIGGGGNGTPTTVDNSILSKTVTATGKPTIKTWFDAFMRERKTEKDGFNQKIYQVISYDQKGNVATSTTPFFSGDVPVVTSYQYNWQNDITLTQNPEQAISYNYVYGYTVPQDANYSTRVVTQTTVTAPDGKTKLTLIDAAGDIIETTDNNGSKLEYVYNSFHQPKEVKLDGVVVSTMEYDDFGNQRKLIDPNAGITEYIYDAFGQLTFQKDANLKEVTIIYDILGRPTERTDNDNNISSYTYYDMGNGINQPKEIIHNGITQNFTYTSLGSLAQQKETIDGTDYVYSYEYDNLNRLTQTTYPSGFKTKHTYNTAGYPSSITDEQVTNTIWQAIDMNANEQYKSFTLGNNDIITTKTYNNYGMLETIQSFSQSTSNYVQNLKYDFDLTNGNLNYRQDLSKGLLEEFAYADNMGRLTQTKVNGVIQINTSYQNNGNLQNKTDAGNYIYHQDKKNAVVRVTNQSNISSFVQEISYTAFNSVETILENNKELTFTYGADQQRRKMDYLNNGVLESTTRYFGNYEKIEKANGDVTEVHYIPGGDGMAAIYVIDKPNGQTATTSYYYTHTDYLGSILTLTDQNANVVYEQNFDAWGRERNPSNWTYTQNTGTKPNWLIRGYTGHEHLNEFGLINMNGRLYDPVLGRMLSPDNYVQSPLSTQSYNRYSYVINNPLKYIDPSGEFGFFAGFLAGYLISGTISHLLGNPGSTTFQIGVSAGLAAGTAGVINPIFGSGSSAVFGSAGAVTIANGAATGAIGGFVGGFSSVFLAGGALNNMLIGGAQGALVGGFIGGVSAGIFNSSSSPTENFSPLRAINGRPSSSSDYLLASLHDDNWMFIDFGGLDIPIQTIDLPTFEFVAQAPISTIQSLPGSGVYKYNPGNIVSYEMPQATSTVLEGNSGWLSNTLMGVEGGATVLSNVVKKGALYNKNAHKLNGSQFAREIEAGRYFNKVAKYLKYGARMTSVLNIGYSFSKSYSGKASWNSFAYDVGTLTVGFVPGAGLPLSLVGTIYKTEIMSLEFAPVQNSHHDRICFIKGTLVFIDNKYENIEDLKQGDYVNSYNFDQQKTELKQIKYFNIEKSVDLYKLITTTDSFVVTSEHPFYVIGKEWVKAKDLIKEDKLKNYSEQIIQVINVEKLDEEREVYNIEVDTNNNFYVGNGKILVHNSSYTSIKNINERRLIFDDEN